MTVDVGGVAPAKRSLPVIFPASYTGNRRYTRATRLAKGMGGIYAAPTVSNTLRLGIPPYGHDSSYPRIKGIQYLIRTICFFT